MILGDVCYIRVVRCCSGDREGDLIGPIDECVHGLALNWAVKATHPDFEAGKCNAAPDPRDCMYCKENFI